MFGLVALVAMLVVGTVMAEDEGQDVGAPILQMVCNGSILTIENVGYDHADIGGLIVVDEDNSVVANVPFGTVLQPGGFKMSGSKYIAEVNVTSGTALKLTNQLGTYCTCVVQ